MRTLGLVLFGLLLTGMCRADDKPEDAKQTERLKQVLDKWEKATKPVREMHYRFTQTEDDHTFQTKKVRTGQVFVKMPELIRVDLTEPDGTTTYFLYEKRQVHCFKQIEKDKTEFVLALPERFGFPEHPEKYSHKGFPDSWIGMALESASPQLVLQPTLLAAQAIGDLRLTKEDENWVYLDLQPRTSDDKCDYRRFEIVLDAKTYQVRRYWFEQPNGYRSWWDIEKLDIKPEPPITSATIRKGLPQDWKQVMFPTPNKK